ncbi:nif11-like leader peptide domain protein [Synechococcus sp. BIOS-E4-1]|uniref:Nif11-like leader peptide family natural product precursor n=1 Tax=Synechococcus sp. BIOS-E4-1 TaxID=1400864 RepID=UPI001648D2A3|nr:Nif11-like leader peptide family natural product precursor [Synechococcus sp. BIOS-E4-1]QNI54491.1 nif11-like leader peptide domain protein [Synechococcus sp. BIOS-E4-1]
MTQEQLTAFIANAKGNTSLQGQLKAAADTNAVAAIAKEAGFSISADDLKNAQSEVSDEELEGVAGGADRPATYYWGPATYGPATYSYLF